MFGKRNTISGNVTSGCWSVNFLKSNKEQNRDANVTLSSDSIKEQLSHSREILHGGCTSCDRAFLLLLFFKQPLTLQTNVVS